MAREPGQPEEPSHRAGRIGEGEGRSAGPGEVHLAGQQTAQAAGVEEADLPEVDLDLPRPPIHVGQTARQLRRRRQIEVADHRQAKHALGDQAVDLEWGHEPAFAAPGSRRQESDQSDRRGPILRLPVYRARDVAFGLRLGYRRPE
jgi:hypothetical protein